MFVNGRRRQKPARNGRPRLARSRLPPSLRRKSKTRAGDDDTTGFKQRQQRFTLRYRVDLRFAYKVGERDYIGTTWAWGWIPFYGRHELAEKVTGQYSKGQKVTVYYDPAQPNIAVLEPASRQAFSRRWYSVRFLRLGVR